MVLQSFEYQTNNPAIVLPGLIIGFLLYWLPFIVSLFTRNRRLLVFILDFFTFVFFIPWIVALVLALIPQRPKAATAPPGYATPQQTYPQAGYTQPTQPSVPPGQGAPGQAPPPPPPPPSQPPA